MDRVIYPKFTEKEDLYKWLVANKDSLAAQKKAITKEADAIIFRIVNKDGNVSKENAPFIPNTDEFTVKVVINTTNLMDSHLDVHIPGLWTKSLKENKMLMHVQEHISKFDHIISDGADLKAMTQILSWEQLGFSNLEGKTEALVFESLVTKERNEFMFKQYSKGYVKNHSVGMRYVQIIMCINDKAYGAEFEAWEKYFPMVANKETAEDMGFFWAVKEAKVVEGSAVVLGSNFITPTLDNNFKSEPSEDTQKVIEPPEGTQKSKINLYILNS